MVAWGGAGDEGLKMLGEMEGALVLCESWGLHCMI